MADPTPKLTQSGHWHKGLGWAIATSLLLGNLMPQASHAQTPIGQLRRQASTTISGIVRSVVGNEFILDDGTGQIIVDAGPHWYHQINIRQGEQLTVMGEYDDYDFDAYRITRSNGETVVIREANSPPPWAGGRRR